MTSPPPTTSSPPAAGTPRPAPDLSRLRAIRVGSLDENSIHKLIDLKSSLSTIEITLTAITVAVVVLKVTVAELAGQLGALMTDTAARQMLDVSVAVGFLTIVIATLQIPRHFTDALIYANQSALRILLQVGATPDFVATCFARVIRRSMIAAAAGGLALTAGLYLIVAEVARIWVPATRTGFLLEVGEAALVILVFIVVVNQLVRRKVKRFYSNFQRW